MELTTFFRCGIVGIMSEITFAENEPTATPKTVKARAKFDLICASKVKKYALSVAQSNPAPQRAKMFTRVSEDFLMLAEGVLRNWIVNRVRSQPSKGKTLT